MNGWSLLSSALLQFAIEGMLKILRNVYIRWFPVGVVVHAFTIGSLLLGFLPSSQFLSKLAEHNLDYVVAIRSNHAVWLPSNQSVRANKWCKTERTFSNQKSETRYIREIIYGKKRPKTYWEITTDPATMPENSTSFVMTNIQGNLKKTLADLYGLRTWVEYGFRQCKQELGGTDYRFTHFKDIERWWEIIFCVYSMISLSSPAFLAVHQFHQIQTDSQESNKLDFSNHQ